MSGKRKLSETAESYRKFYDLTRREAEVVERIDAVVTEALRQYDQGFAVDVEGRIVGEARRIIADLVGGEQSE
jgi:hypothetical protein